LVNPLKDKGKATEDGADAKITAQSGQEEDGSKAEVF
jgi:hypothetical protein